MDPDTVQMVTGILQCVLAVIAIGVDIFLAVFAGRFVKNKKYKEETSKATDAINANATTEIDVEEQDYSTIIPDEKLKKQVQGIFKKLKKNHNNTYPSISAISMVIAFKDLYDGNESLVVRGLNTAKQKGYMTWSGEKLLPSTIIIINKDKENELIDYLGSRKS